MSDDRELLELAAKAAGIVVMRSRLDDPICRDFLVQYSARNIHHENGAWNPLTDDGDALRLAVKLGICIKFIPSCDTVQAYQEREFTAEPFNGHSDDLCDIGTRRAIVRAAAEIGKSMP